LQSSAQRNGAEVIRAVERIKEGGRSASGDDESSLMKGREGAWHTGNECEHEAAKSDQHLAAPVINTISDKANV
jgi:hypothetical protein